MFIASALSRGLSVGFFQSMTIGQIADIFMEFAPEEDRVYEATQDDIKSFFQ